MRRERCKIRERRWWQIQFLTRKFIHSLTLQTSSFLSSFSSWCTDLVSTYSITMTLYPLPLKLRVLFLVDIVTTLLWCCCYLRFLILLPMVGRHFLPGGIADFFHVVAVLPLVGFIATKLLYKRFSSVSDVWALFSGLRMVWVCYGVIYPHPRVARHTSYSFLILAWSLQSIIDYTYHTFKLKTRTSPSILFWLHYHHFYLTFPIALCSELILTFLSLKFAETARYELALKACVALYVPIGYFTFGHLQTRKEKKYDGLMAKRAIARAQAASASLQ